MSTEFGLYDQRTKTYLWLGKACEGGFQCPDAKIAAFLSGICWDTKSLSICNDIDDRPDQLEPGWVEAGS